MTGVIELARDVVVNDGSAPPAAVAVMAAAAGCAPAVWGMSVRAAARWLTTYLPARPVLRGACHGIHLARQQEARRDAGRVHGRQGKHRHPEGGGRELGRRRAAGHRERPAGGDPAGVHNPAVLTAT